jgi:hypothetical protein
MTTSPAEIAGGAIERPGRFSAIHAAAAPVDASPPASSSQRVIDAPPPSAVLTK